MRSRLARLVNDTGDAAARALGESSATIGLSRTPTPTVSSAAINKILVMVSPVRRTQGIASAWVQ